MELNSELKNYLESTINALNLPEMPYFKALSAGKLSREQFLETQYAFAVMVFSFSRPMAQIMVNIPDALLRTAMAENLREEHGQGTSEDAHCDAILTLISRLGGDPAKVNIQQPPMNARIFNETIRDVCSFADYRFSVAVYAGIERTFADVSTLVYEAIKNQGWLEETQITHYGSHKGTDIEHVENLLKVVNESWAETELQDLIKDGIKFGSDLLVNAYTSFYYNLHYSKSEAVI